MPGPGERVLYPLSMFGPKRLMTIVCAIGLVWVASMPSQSALAAPGEPEWLQIVNRYRASAGLSPVTENREASAGAKKHASYQVLNRVATHDEDRKRKGYSPEGERAGLTGNVSAGSGRAVPTQRELIEAWLTAPFHGLAILGPKYTAFGFGVSGTPSSWAASLPVFWDRYRDPSALEVAPDLDGAVDRVTSQFPDLGASGWNATGTVERIVVTIDGRRFSVTATEVRELSKEEIAELDQPATANPITVWPGNATSIPLVRYAGNEFPNPLAGCPGYSKSAGLPILLFGRPIEFDKVVMTEVGGKSLTLCVLTAQSFRSRDDSERKQIQEILSEAAVLIPKAGLTPGRKYRVLADVVDGPQLDWTFNVAPTSAIGLPSNHPRAGDPTPGIAYQLQRKSASVSGKPKR